MTTHRNFYGQDHATVTAAIIAKMPNSYMRTNLSSNWRGWRDQRGELDLGAAGSINAPSCGVVYHLQLKGPPAIVQDQDAAPGRRYSLLAYLRTQLDPMPAFGFPDDFDVLLKDQLKDHFNTNPGVDEWADVAWAEGDRGDVWMETLHVLNFTMGY